MAQVTLFAASPIGERGMVAQHTCGVPEVPDGQSQVVVLATNGNPTLSGSDWRLLVASDPDAAPARLMTFWRPGPRAAEGIQITYGGASAITLGSGFGVSGAPKAHAKNTATQSTASEGIPTPASVATEAESLTISAICSGYWPRRFDLTKPTDSTDIRYDWSYTPAGGMGFGLCYQNTAAFSAYWPRQWTPDNPDVPGGPVADFWRLQTISFLPAAVTPPVIVKPQIAIGAMASWAPAPVVTARSPSATSVEITYDVSPYALATGFQIYMTPEGTADRISPALMPAGQKGVLLWTNLVPGTRYVASVRTLRAADNGHYVDAVSAMAETPVQTQGQSLIIPTNIRVTPTSATTATMTWTLTALPGVTTQIWIGPIDGVAILAGTAQPGANTFTAQGLAPNTTYKVQMRAMSGASPGIYSETVNFRTPAAPVDPTDPGSSDGSKQPSDRVKRNLRLMHHH